MQVAAKCLRTSTGEHPHHEGDGKKCFHFAGKLSGWARTFARPHPTSPGTNPFELTKKSIAMEVTPPICG
jgi:hypothetical protein